MNEVNWEGLEDEAEWAGGTAEVSENNQRTAVEIPGFVENCTKCGGSGNWRPGYPCFKCKGKGKLTFKTSPDQRKRGRKSAAKSKANKAAANEATWNEFLAGNKPVQEWLVAGVLAGNDFASSLSMAGKQYGALTDGQLKAVYNAMARDAEGEASFAEWCEAYPGVLKWLTDNVAAGNEFAGSLLAAGKRFGSLTSGQLNAVNNNIEQGKGDTGAKESDLDLGELPKGYYAVPDGDTRLKLAVRRPGKNSRWQGWIFVDDGAAYGSRQTYGKQGPDELYKGKVQDQLRAIMEDPKGAMAEYGKLTGTCGMCGRILEDEESVARGLGPICAAK